VTASMGDNRIANL